MESLDNLQCRDRIGLDCVSVVLLSDEASLN